EGATTVQWIRSCAQRRASTKPVGPASSQTRSSAPGWAFLSLAKTFSNRVQIVGDGPVATGFAAAAFGKGQGDVLRVDIESQKQ
ncbi:MAG TPA: hypothetical protein VFD27_08245, partial [Chthoniobacteraceae bacterium]|nr:hypothetical protein [Chthoniobacteraceae bacterium]